MSLWTSFFVNQQLTRAHSSQIAARSPLLRTRLKEISFGSNIKSENGYYRYISFSPETGFLLLF